MRSILTSARSSILIFILIGVLLNVQTTECETINIRQRPCSNGSFNSSELDVETLNNVLWTLSSDSILYLEEGEHCIRNFTLVRHLKNVTITGNGESSTLVKCTQGNGLAFFNVSDLTIEGISILHCGLDRDSIENFTNHVKHTIDYFFRISGSPDNHIALACANCTNFKLWAVVIANTSGLGFLGINLVGDSVIQNASFTGNVPEGCFHVATDDVLQEEKTGGGALIIYHDYVDMQRNDSTTLLVENTTFYNNSYCGVQGVYEIYSHYSEEFSLKHFLLGGGGGLSVVLTQIHYRVNVLVENSIFMNNTAQYGGGANVEIFTAVFDSHVMFRNCSFIKNGLDDNLVLSLDYTTFGSGLGFISDILQPTFNRSVDTVPRFRQVPCTLVISESKFTENRAFGGGAILIISLYAPLLGGTLQKRLHIESSHFERNYGVLGGAVYALEWKQSVAQRGLDVIFHDVTFDGNIVYSIGDVSAPVQNSAVIELLTLNVTFSGDSFIMNSDGTGVRSMSGIVSLMDNITFSNNSGSYGGALRLESGALLLLRKNARVQFYNNAGAVYGGAVYTSKTATIPSLSEIGCPIYFGTLNLLCFSTVHSNCTDITEYDVEVHFAENLAPLGSVLYGTTLESCPWAKHLRRTYAPNSNLTLFELFDRSLWESDNFSSPFYFDKSPNNTVEVSTGTGKIIINESHISGMPGETITLTIQTLDDFNRSVPTLLTTLPSLDAKSHHISTLIGRSHYFLLQPSVDPTNLGMEANITVFGNENIDSVNVSLFSLISITQSEIVISVTNCSEGFTYINSSHSCECSKQVNYKRSRINCNNKDFTLTVPEDVWVGPGPNGELIVHACYFDYCLSGKRTIKPPDFDKQCQDDYNRGGIACGQCLEGYSIVFGSNRCLKCSNNYLSMIIVFALLGIGLVSAISFLQITISEGYLNGMLFYVDILTLYLPFLTESGSNIVHIFFFVSLLNLNLGIECCFYDGMKAIARTGLNLVFPLYLFLLMLIIVGIAKRSNRFSNWFTRNGFSAVKVFVTLILMSYSSLLETCIEILGFAQITTTSGTYIQWRVDSNQGYFRGYHILLGLVAIVLLIFLLPLPFLLLFEGKLFKFHIFHRYKPLYDAVWAPFKPKFRFWVGLRLILRGLPFIFAYFFAHPLNILLLATFLVSLLWTQGMLRPFRGFARNAFDTFFISDLLIITLGALYFYIYLAQFEITDNTKEDEIYHLYQIWFYSIIVGIAYIGFLVIIFWHMALRFPRLMNLLDYVLRQFKKTSSSKSHRKLITFTDSRNRKSQSEYGSIDGDRVTPSDREESSQEDEDHNSGDVIHERKKIVSYSQWREPLLDSGSLEVEIRNHDKT